MNLIAPHGDTLVNLIVDQQQHAALKEEANSYPSIDLNPRQLCDLELLIDGSFSPLTGFMGQADHDRVVSEMRLADGTLWPIPVTLDLNDKQIEHIGDAEHVTLRDPEGVPLAVIDITDRWQPDVETVANGVFGTTDTAHPGVDYLFNKAGRTAIGGPVRALQKAVHYDFRALRLTPAEVRNRFTRLGWRRVVAFQTRNPMHRAHLELTFRAAQEATANLLIHPVVGMTKPGDIDHMTRVRCYQNILTRFPAQTTELSLLNLAMRMAGPREALWHAIIRKNYGCTHLIVGRDHAGPGNDSNGEPFYGPYDAQELLEKHQDELGIRMVPFRMMVYSEHRAEYIPVDEVRENESILNISGTELRHRLRENLEIPDWFTYPDVVAELRKTYPARENQGFTVFFTGLSGAGKSTIANGLMVRLMEMGNRSVTLLDGDIVRKHLSSELGFSREHRNINVTRIGFVASEISKNGGVALCAPIAPYSETRKQVREMIEPYGPFVEVYVSTPIDVCERRDRKGLYALAREGKIKEFTGISDPYEAPVDPEVQIDTSECSNEEAVQRIILKLENLGLIVPES